MTVLFFCQAKRGLILFTMCCLFTPLAVLGEDLLSIYHMAQTNDPTLQAAKAALLAAKEVIPQARANFLPQINATTNNTAYHFSDVYDATIISQGNFSTNTTELSYNQNSYAIKLTQPIFYYQEWVKYAQASKQAKQANATYAAAEQDLIVRTAQRYFGVLKAYDALKFARAQRKALTKFLDQTEQRFKVGLIAITDVQIARAQRDSAYAQEIAAENQLANAKEQLREITGQPVNTFSFLREQFTLKAPEPANLDQWVSTAIEQNFSLQASRFQLEATRANIKITDAEHLPTLSIESSATRLSRGPTSPTSTNSLVGLQVKVPVFHGGAISSKTKQATYLYEQAQKQLESSYRTVESTTRQAFRGVLTQISQVTASKQAIVSNQSALEATEASFNVGTRTIVDVLNSQSNLTQAEQNYANARYDYILQSIQLKQAAGTLSPLDIQHINAWLTENKTLPN